MRLLLAEDEKELSSALTAILRHNHYEVDAVYDGEQALNYLRMEDYDAAILDVMMPKMDGLEMCRRIRKTSNIPIIMLSAKTADMDKILGFGTGVDDYVTKPFNPLELTARVKSQLKRYQNINTVSSQNQVVQIGTLTIEKAAHRVLRGGEEIALTPIEFEILWLLASHPGRVYSTDEIFEQVWKEQVYEVNNTVMVHIRRLREKIELDTKNPAIIKTVWGVGYKVEAE